MTTAYTYLTEAIMRVQNFAIKENWKSTAGLK